MTRFLCCALALAGCGGSPIAPLIGSYALLGVSNKETSGGRTETTTVAGDGKAKLIVTRDPADATGQTQIVISLSGREITKAFVNAQHLVTTLARVETNSDSNCQYTTTWSAGGPVTLDGQVLTIKRSGSARGTQCVPPVNDFTSTVEQTVQAQRD